MPDLLLELRSEEIPARMQRKAAGDLRKLVTDGMVDPTRVRSARVETGDRGLSHSFGSGKKIRAG
ncbi:MAG: hypothetical protein M9905_19915 [Rhizobiaceae bacterium]|nr:hypothetical protein [Rhizobiaceae bacterium]